MPEIVLLDANIWHSSNLLRTPEAVSLIAYLTQTSSKLLFTSLLCHEVKSNAKSAVERAHRHAREAMRDVFWRSGLDPRSGNIVPVHDGVAAIDARLARLQPLFYSPEPTLPVFTAAHSRVINKVPPSHGAHQQYKDAFLLEELLAVQGFSRKVLVTEDGDFWFRKSPPELHPQIAGAPDLVAFSSLREFLSSTENVSTVELEQRARLAIASLTFAWIMGDALNEEIYLVRDDEKSANRGTFAAFHTTDPGRLAVDFQLPLFGDIQDIEGQWHEGLLTLTGSCLLETADFNMTDYAISRSRLETDEELVAEVDWGAHRNSSVLRPTYKPIVHRAKPRIQ